MGISKNRIFAFLIYLDSAPEDWVALLETLGIPMAISPLHDKDKPEPMTDNAIRKRAEREAKAYVKTQTYWDDNARKEAYEKLKQQKIDELTLARNNLPEFKKAHHHVLYVNPNPVTAESVLRKLKRKLGDKAVNKVEIVDNIENYHLYLTHESADAKAHNKPIYDKTGIRYLNNFDITRYITMDKEEKQDLFIALVEEVDKRNILNLKQLMEYVREHGSEIGINNTRELIKVIDCNVWFLRLLFDGNYQELHNSKFDELIQEQAKNNAKFERLLNELENQ